MTNCPVILRLPATKSGSRDRRDISTTMMKQQTKKRLALGLIAATIGSGLTLGSGTTPVSADPTQLNALVGMGSDTTQDVMNAMAGFNYGQNYKAINSGASSNYRHLISFDAAPAQSASDNCVTPVINGPTFTRPNGSTAGRKALYAGSGLSTAGWTGVDFVKDDLSVIGTCGTAVNISGAVNFARSSSLKSGTGTDVVFIPMGRDAVTFASYRPGGGTPVTSLTRKQLIDSYDNATLEVINDPDGSGTLTIVPCGIQTSSGTHSFWRDTVVKSDASKEALAVATCLTAGARLQESKGDLLKARGDTLDATLNDFVVIVGFSAAAYIAQANGVSAPNGYADITIGGISDDSEAGTGGATLGSPVSGVAPTLVPNGTFYTSAGHGRDVYNVIRRSLIVNTGTGVLLNNAYTSLFATASSQVCTNTAVLNKFGFASIGNCGDYTTNLKAWDTGAA